MHSYTRWSKEPCAASADIVASPTFIAASQRVTVTKFRDAIDKATVAIPDSTILQWAYALRFGEKPISATHGADIMMQLCDLAATASIPIGFYGGKG